MRRALLVPRRDKSLGYPASVALEQPAVIYGLATAKYRKAGMQLCAVVAKHRSQIALQISALRKGSITLLPVSKEHKHRHHVGSSCIVRRQGIQPVPADAQGGIEVALEVAYRVADRLLAHNRASLA